MLRKFLFPPVSIILFAGSLFGQSHPNDIIEKSKGSWDLPISRYIVIQDNKFRVRERVYDLTDSSWRFISDSCYDVKAVFAGVVIEHFEIEGSVSILTRFGDYFLLYSNLSNSTVEKGEIIKAGRVLGKMRKELDGEIFLDFSIMKDNKIIGPQNWFKKGRGVQHGIGKSGRPTPVESNIKICPPSPILPRCMPFAVLCQ